MSGLDFEQTVVYGPSGLGNVKFNKKKNGQISSVKVVSEDTTVYPISADNIGDGVITDSRNGIYYQLSPDETKLTTIRPWDGIHPVQFGGFTRRGEDQEEAEPYVKRGGKRTKTHPSGKTSTYTVQDQLRFTSVLEIVGGDFKGYSAIYWLQYIFERGNDGVAKAVSRSGIALDKLKEFMSLAGWDTDNEPIPYSENVLPYLERELLDRASNNTFITTFEGGWPTNLEEMQTGLTFS